jgi:hypothetical protein
MSFYVTNCWEGGRGGGRDGGREGKIVIPMSEALRAADKNWAIEAATCPRTIFFE